LSEAEISFRKSIEINPNFAGAHNGLGNILRDLVRIEEALGCYQRAVALAPSDALLYNNIGITLTDIGDIDGACLAFERAVALAPRCGNYYRTLAGTGRVSSVAMQSMEKLACDMVSLPENDQMELHFALGRVYEDRAQHERSFPHLVAGNRLKRRSIDYDEGAALRLLDRIRATFTAERLADGAATGVRTSRPVFIVGMPRSGTTLVEQILSSHPDVFGAGELKDLPGHIDRIFPDNGVLGFPEVVAGVTGATLRRLGTFYLAGLRSHAPSAKKVVDKLCSNFRFIGLIHMALPDAQIIHVIRDPIDTCLSCFSREFLGQLPFTYDLAELGRYYRAYEEVMEHWRQVLPKNAMLEVRYEDVVADVEGQARRMLTYCDLEWDARCLDFHQTKRIVQTASAAQVRQPIYKTSVGRWRPDSALLKPLTDAFGVQ
jgi:tetratricopeptide (TPR) repeat protein